MYAKWKFFVKYVICEHFLTIWGYLYILLVEAVPDLHWFNFIVFWWYESITHSMKVTQWWCATLCDPMDYTVHRILQARIQEWVAVPFSRGSSKTRDRTQASRIADSLPAEPQGKPKNTGVGSLSLLQGIFQTQGSSPGLPHCRQILYQLSS